MNHRRRRFVLNPAQAYYQDNSFFENDQTRIDIGDELLFQNNDDHIGHHYYTKSCYKFVAVLVCLFLIYGVVTLIFKST